MNIPTKIQDQTEAQSVDLASIAFLGKAPSKSPPAATIVPAEASIICRPRYKFDAAAEHYIAKVNAEAIIVNVDQATGDGTVQDMPGAVSKAPDQNKILQVPAGDVTITGYDTSATVSPAHAGALQMASRGFPVFPLHGIVNGKCTCSGSEPGKACKAGKHPHFSGSMATATINPELINGWFKKYPYVNYGVRLGQEMGNTGKMPMVIDVDLYKPGGAETLDALEATHGRLPDTAEVQSGAGGRHCYFMADHTLSFHGDMGKNIDVKVNGYVVGPGSLHAEGTYYDWEGSSNPFEGQEIADLPQWVIDNFSKAKRDENAAEISVTNVPLSEPEVACIKADLSDISAACSRSEWLKILMGLHARNQSLSMFKIADEWSQTSPEKYDAAAVVKAWNSFEPGGGVTYESVRHAAMKERTKDVDVSNIIKNEKTKPIVKSAEPIAVAAPTHTFSLRDSTANRLFLGKPKAVSWLVEGIFPQAKAIILASPPGVGKSFMSLNLAVAVASAPSALNPAFCFGGQVKAHGRVVIVSAEDDHDELHRRLAAITKEMPARLHVVSLPDTGYFSFLQGDTHSGMTPTAQWSDLKKQIEELDDVRLVIVDTLQALSCGDMNAAEVAQAMMNELTELANRTGAAVIALHHLTKGTASAQNGLLSAQSAMDSIRGSGAIVGAVRSAYCLFPHPTGQKICETLNIPYEENKVIYGLVAKANGPARRDRSVFIRSETGLLEDRTMQYNRAMGGDNSLLESELLAEIISAHTQGKAFAASTQSKNGLHKRREELPKQFRDKSATWFSEVTTRLTKAGKLVEKSSTNGFKLSPPEGIATAVMPNTPMLSYAESIESLPQVLDFNE